MADPTCDQDAPPPPPSTATMAVATGAAMLAGMVLGKKGLTGLAAGVAAAAGAKLLSHLQHDDATQAPPEAPPHAEAELLPPESQPDTEPLDWVDNDAVMFGHLVPDPKQAGEMLQEKSLPLLDDDGLPVEHVTVTPVYPEPPASDFPLGPIIWEPGRFAQSRSESAGETVWFGLQDVVLETPKPALDRASKVGQSPTGPVDADDAGESAQAASSSGEEAQMEPEADDGPSPEPDTGSTPPEFTVPAPAVGPASSGESMAGQPSALASIIKPKPGAGKSILPQRRAAGVLPGQHLQGEQAKSDAPATAAAAAPSSGASEHPRARTMLPPRGSANPSLHRHLEPIAPVMPLPAPRRRWPLLLVMALLTAIALFYAVDRWQQGDLMRRMQALPWFSQKAKVEVGKAEVPRAIPAPQPVPPQGSPAPAPAPSPGKRSPWINAVAPPEDPEPVLPR